MSPDSRASRRATSACSHASSRRPRWASTSPSALSTTACSCSWFDDAASSTASRACRCEVAPVAGPQLELGQAVEHTRAARLVAGRLHPGELGRQQRACGVELVRVGQDHAELEARPQVGREALEREPRARARGPSPRAGTSEPSTTSAWQASASEIASSDSSPASSANRAASRVWPAERARSPAIHGEHPERGVDLGRQGRVAGGLVQRALAQADGSGHVVDRVREPPQQPRALGAGREGGDERVQDRPRPARVARRDVVLGGRRQAPASRLAVLRGSAPRRARPAGRPSRARRGSPPRPPPARARSRRAHPAARRRRTAAAPARRRPAPPRRGGGARSAVPTAPPSRRRSRPAAGARSARDRRRAAARRRGRPPRGRPCHPRRARSASTSAASRRR